MLDFLTFVFPYVLVSVLITVAGILLLAVVGIVPGLPPAYRWTPRAGPTTGDSPAIIPVVASATVNSTTAALAVMTVIAQSADGDVYGGMSSGSPATGTSSDATLIISGESADSSIGVVVAGRS